MSLLENGRKSFYLLRTFSDHHIWHLQPYAVICIVTYPCLMRLQDMFQPFHPLVLCLLVLLTLISTIPKYSQCIFQSPMLTTDR